MAKTKVQLEQEIRDSRDQITALKCELEHANRVESKENAAGELFEMYNSYVTVGFSEAQAWELTRILMDNSTKPKRLF